MFANRIEAAFAYLGVFYLTGATIVLLSPGGDTDGSPAYRLVGIGLGAVSILFLFGLKNTFDRVIRNYWPILILVLLCSVSFFWSSDPEVTVRRAAALTLSAAFAIWLCERFSPQVLLGIVARTLAFTCIACAAVALLVPTMGVHQAGEPIAGLEELFNDNLYLHAGSWRGLFAHKNDFGRFAALSTLVFTAMALSQKETRLPWLVATFWAAVLVVLSNSSQAIVLAILPVVVLAACAAFRRPAGDWRALAIVLVVGSLVIGLFLTNVVLDAALALLGKDATLSGRTQIWSLVLVGLSDHFALGGGYGAGMVLVQPALAADFGGHNVGHAHNGYLDLAIDVGLVGLGLTLLIVAAIGVAAVRRFFGPGNDPVAPLGIQYVVFYLLGNVAGSFLFNYNSIYLLVFFVLYRGLVARASFVQTWPVSSRQPSDAKT